jgi:alpha-1,2-glucosyltransferase
LLGACFACLLWTLLYACQFQGEIVDENYHAAQIFAFLRGNFVVVPALTTVPGYHLLMAGIAKLLSLHSMQGLRIINVSFGFISAFIFYAIRRFFDDPNALIYSVAFFFFPIFYPYYFLVYTDILSLSLILAAFLMALNERHILAACLLTFALLVRQNNVIWAAFFMVFSIF